MRGYLLSSLPELQGSPSIKSKSSAGHLCRIGGEPLGITDGPPEAPQEDVEAAVLVPRARLAPRKPQRPIRA